MIKRQPISARFAKEWKITLHRATRVFANESFFSPLITCEIHTPYKVFDWQASRNVKIIAVMDYEEKHYLIEWLRMMA